MPLSTKLCSFSKRRNVEPAKIGCANLVYSEYLAITVFSDDVMKKYYLNKAVGAFSREM